jgi:hypothetical protein
MAGAVALEPRSDSSHPSSSAAVSGPMLCIGCGRCVVVGRRLRHLRSERLELIDRVIFRHLEKISCS